VAGIYCKQNPICEHDYWCKDCQIGFCSCSKEGDDHDYDVSNIGHKVYDACQLDLEPVYIVEDYKGIKAAAEAEKKLPPVDESAKILIKMLNDSGVPIPTDFTFDGTYARFSIEGPRNSIAIYRVWGRGIVDVWFGKSDEDSGGKAMQGSLHGGIKDIINLQKRFYQSGRLKVLRNHRRY
jgi:hypothetical protein